MSATVPLYITALSLYCRSAARPIRARAREHYYILYRKMTTAVPRIKIMAVNIF